MKRAIQVLERSQMVLVVVFLVIMSCSSFFQVLNQNTFLRKMSVIRYTREAVHADAADIIRLAEAEGLSAHANAVRLRAEEE